MLSNALSLQYADRNKMFEYPINIIRSWKHVINENVATQIFINPTDTETSFHFNISQYSVFVVIFNRKNSPGKDMLKNFYHFDQQINIHMVC